MKYISIVAILLSLNAFAGHVCHVEKSLLIWDSNAGGMKIELATTDKFPVVDEAHQDAFELDFKKENGEIWGSVNVSTGTHEVKGEKQFHCNASITDENNELVTFLNVYANVGAPFAKALTLMNVEGLPPSVSIICEYW